METPSGKTQLVRALGRWDWTALVINSVIGSGIFGLPALLLGLVGGASPLACLLAGAAIAVIALCFAEVASRFQAAGGPYLYAREAFGSFVGLQVGWVAWLVRITSAAANANLLVIYLAELWPEATGPAARVALLTSLLLFFAGVNYRGVRWGAQVSNFFTVAKLLPLGLFILAGLFFMRGGSLTGLAGGSGQWAEAMLLLVFAYGGFESAMIPASETRDPRRHAPFALLVGLGAVALVYGLVQLVVVGTLSPAAVTDRPLAEAARQFLGTGGGLLMAVGAVISVSGLLSSTMLNSPRLTYALAERGDFPAFFAAVHPRFRTPHLSILLYAALSWALAVWGSFEWNAVLSAVARLVIYLTTCAALLVLRRRGPAEAFRAPAGTLCALAGIGFCLWLLARMGRGEFFILAATFLLAAATWVWSRRRQARAG